LQLTWIEEQGFGKMQTSVHPKWKRSFFRNLECPDISRKSRWLGVISDPPRAKEDTQRDVCCRNASLVQSLAKKICKEETFSRWNTWLLHFMSWNRWWFCGWDALSLLFFRSCVENRKIRQRKMAQCA